MVLPDVGPESAPIATAAPARPRRRLIGDTQPHPTQEPNFAPRNPAFFVYLTAFASFVATAAAWLVPETVASAALGWLGATLLVYSMRLRPAYLPAFCRRNGRPRHCFLLGLSDRLDFRRLRTGDLGIDLRRLRRTGLAALPGVRIFLSKHETICRPVCPSRCRSRWRLPSW